MGLVNQLTDFSIDIATTTNALRPLMRAGHPFIWNSDYECYDRTGITSGYPGNNKNAALGCFISAKFLNFTAPFEIGVYWVINITLIFYCNFKIKFRPPTPPFYAK